MIAVVLIQPPLPGEPELSASAQINEVFVVASEDEADDLIARLEEHIGYPKVILQTHVSDSDVFKPSAG